MRRAAAVGAVGLGASVLGACGSSGSSGSETTATGGTETAAAAEPRRGGRFILGIAGSPGDNIDPHLAVSTADAARMVATFDQLGTYDENFRPVVDGIAEELSPNANGDEWTIRLKQGIEFHNGKTVTADDVIYSIRRETDPSFGASGLAMLAGVERDGFTKLDERTVRMKLSRPNSQVLAALSYYFSGIVPEGFSPGELNKSGRAAIGTGPFKVESFTPGERSVHVRNPNYWREGLPYFDELEIISSLADGSARVNALMGGQVTAITDVPYAQVATIEGRSDLRLSAVDKPSNILNIAMRCDKPPFNDVRVRQAVRLLCDREQMVQVAIQGHGTPGLDIFSPGDGCFDAELFAKREQDIEQAKSLLKAAGQSDLRLELIADNARTGQVEGAQLLEQYAREAGITLKVRAVDPGTLYGDEYLNWTFATDFWPTAPYTVQTAWTGLGTSQINAAHFDDREFNDLYNQVLATVEEGEQCRLIQEMMRIEHDRGGYLIWAYNQRFGAYSADVGGFRSVTSQNQLNNYGNQFSTIYFT